MNYSDIKKNLEETYKYKIELHAHTYPASSCSEVSPEEVIKIFHEAGYNGVAITNHFHSNLFKSYYKLKNKKEILNKFLSDYYRAEEEGCKLGVNVYLAAELRWSDINDNDYLIYGIDEKILSDIFDYINTTPEKFYRDCKSEKSFFIQAHPFRTGLERENPAVLDGIEVFNMHPNHNSRIAFAEKHADEYGKIKTIGTDYHHKGHHGLCFTRMKNLPENSFELAAELKRNDFIMQVGSSLILP